MLFYADLHLHSRYSRATSKDCDLEHLALWARKKGISVVATGDFTHPAWRAELGEKLVAAEPGLFRLKPEIERRVEGWLPGAAGAPVRFLLEVEISTIYKKGERTRKVHHLIYVPDLAAADRVIARLAKIGNLAADGRPILGLDSRDLLEIALESGPDSYLVPAHIWTPWFSALGSKSGFDSIADCYGDLAGHIFAVETGLSSDPPMNWRVSSLDRYRLVSSSDAHSPPKLGREACVFDTELDYFAIRRALEGGGGHVGTVEFFPEEGKYHLDGHRKCGVRLAPEESRLRGGRCPVCGQGLTLGVQHRVEELADRADGPPPATAGEVRSLIPLPEILSEIHRKGVASRAVQASYEGLLGRLGPELPLLEAVPLEEVARRGSELLAEALARLRRGEVRRQAGYDGEYGVIRLFDDRELARRTASGLLFAPPAARPPAPEELQGQAPAVPPSALPQVRERAAADAVAEAPAAPVGDLLAGLDREQHAAATAGAGPLLIVAGPGSGKTRTLTHRLAFLITERRLPAERCLAVTFTRRAAEELRQRLAALLPGAAEAVAVHTFHSLALDLLRRHAAAAGLAPGFRIAGEAERIRLVASALGVSARQGGRILAAISRARRRAATVEDEAVRTALALYRRELERAGWLDFDDLVERAVALLEAHPEIASAAREGYRHVAVDEYQDVDALQCRLVRLLVAPGGELTAIGDPHQAIYGFRGADVAFFDRFPEDHPGARVVRLGRNYRSRPVVVAAAARVVGAEVEAVRPDDGSRITVHRAATEKAEAEWVVATVEALFGGHSFFSLDSGRSSGGDAALAFSDVAVLYRTAAQGEPLAEALGRSGMPFRRRSHAPLTELPEVARLVGSLQREAAPGALVERLRTAAAGLTATEGEAGERRAVEEALELLLPFATAAGADLDRFCCELALATQADSWDPRAEAISLLTLHAAKGLEFPVVFLVGCEDGLLPLSWGDDDAPEVEEERRLFYVGVSRARERLFLSWAERRMWRGAVRERHPSPFLAALDGERLERTGRQEGPRRPTQRQLSLF